MNIPDYMVFLVFFQAVKGQDDCHCQNNNACSTYNCKSQCDPYWSGPACQRQNIAIGSSLAFQSSVSFYCSGECTPLNSKLAVDGDQRTKWRHRCATTTNETATASLTVIFTRPKLIDRIGLYFFDHYKDEMVDFKVFVGSDNDDKLCYTQANTAPSTSHTEIACTQPLVGTRVTITLPSVANKYRSLALCEIEIYECTDLWWGEKCEKKCDSCTGDTALCEQRSGHCYTRSVNIAYGETARFSNSQRPLYGTAGWVIDGNTNDANCAVSPTSAPWWEIQFEKTRSISRIKIFWLSSVIPSSFTITVDEIECYHHVSLPPPPRVFSFSCSSPLRGDRVRIQRQSTEQEYLTLCEVEIFECTDQFYGPDCKHRCNCQGNEYCDKVNGTCFAPIATTVPTTPVTTQSTSSQSTTSSLSTRTSSSTRTTTLSSATTTTSSTTTTAPSTTTTPPSTEVKEDSSTETSSITKNAWSSTSTTEKQEAASGDKSPRRGDPDMTTIIGAAVGGGVGLLLIVIFIAVVCRRKRRRTEPPLENTQRDSKVYNSQTNMGFTHEEETSIPRETVQRESTNILNNRPPYPAVEPVTNAPVQESVYEELPDDPEEEPVLEDTSDAYYNHIPRAIPIMSLREYVQERLDGVGFENEYTFLPVGLRANYETGKSIVNHHKNRFKQIYAYDHSRVLLERDAEEEMEEDVTDYINASYINGYNCPKRFIATQGPIPETVADFWLMVWQQQTKDFIMLANIFEEGRKKCEKYWPPQGEPGNYGIINVCLEKTKEYAVYTVRVLTLHHLGENTKREVRQYHFTTWPDHGIPTTASLVSFWKYVRRQMTPFGGDNGPLVIHCSAGIGRTGTYIGLDYLVEEAEGEGKVNIFTAVLGMRDDRVNMVQTKGQYSFLHLALLEALHSKNTWTAADQIPAKLAPGDKVIHDEYQNMDVMASLRIPVEKKKGRGDQEASMQEEIEENKDNSVSGIKVTTWPSYFNIRGFLHVDTFAEDLAEEFWNIVCSRNATTIITINQDTPAAMPTAEGTSDRSGSYYLNLTSKGALSDGITERKLTVTCDATDMETSWKHNGETNVVIYSLTTAETNFDKGKLLSLIDLVIGRQQACGHHPVILQCRDSSTKCALFAAAANVISCLRLDQEVDIYLTVREIQCHKDQPVTCLGDYRFLYELANDYVKSTTKYSNM